MNLPNKLTVVRILLVPFFVLFLLVDSIPLHFVWALLTFAAAAITDFFDGHLARKHNLVTTFGKFLDPLADKVLVLAAMIAFIELGFASSVVVIIVITREFLVTSLRLVAAGDGVVIAAGTSGKIKTASQMGSIVLILLLSAINAITPLPLDLVLISNVLMWVTGGIAVYSGLEYLWQNRRCINTTK